MNRLIIMGLLLSVVIFLPRIISNIPRDKISALLDGGAAGPRAASVATPSAPTSVPRPADAGGKSVAAPGGRSGSAEPGRSGNNLSQRVKNLEALVAKIRDKLLKEHKMRVAADEKQVASLRRLTVAQQIFVLRTKAAGKAFVVPAWQVPDCAKLSAGDQGRFFKIGAGIVSFVREGEFPELAELLSDVVVFNVNKAKTDQVRIYREKPESAGLFTDVIPPERRSPKAVSGFRLGSPHLDATLQLCCDVTDQGELDLEVVLYRVPEGTVIFRTTRSGADFESVVKGAVLEAAGLSRERLQRDAR